MKKVYLFRPKWYMGKAIEQETRKLLIGTSLNFPCGRASFGDVRADIDPSVKADIYADLLSSHKYFKPQSFDTIYCDPPFPFYTDNRIGWKWIYKVSALAKKRIIFKTPKIVIKLKRSLWKKEYIILEDTSVSFNCLQVFDRINKTL